MTFDRAIDASGLNVDAIRVNDGPAHKRYIPTLIATPVNPQTLTLNLVFNGGSFAIGIFMNASAENGIVAADDGGAWAGVDGLVLPFP